MVSEEEARAKILETVRPLPPRQLSISGALDCFAAEDYCARLPLPNFDNSAMDGYAVIASDSRHGAKLRVVGEQPAGADAVLMQEDVTRNGDEIVVNEDVEAGEFVRKRGCDLSEGQKILSRGERIREATLGLLASQGFAEVCV